MVRECTVYNCKHFKCVGVCGMSRHMAVRPGKCFMYNRKEEVRCSLGLEHLININQVWVITRVASVLCNLATASLQYLIESVNICT